jgi:hypothetical protein
VVPVLIRVTTDDGHYLDVPGLDEADEQVQMYADYFKAWKPGDEGSLSWAYPDGGWVLIPTGRVVTLELLPEPQPEPVDP